MSLLSEKQKHQQSSKMVRIDKNLVPRDIGEQINTIKKVNDETQGSCTVRQLGDEISKRTGLQIPKSSLQSLLQSKDKDGNNYFHKARSYVKPLLNRTNVLKRIKFALDEVDFSDVYTFEGVDYYKFNSINNRIYIEEKILFSASFK